MMGIADPKHSGVFRKTAATVGNPELLLPAPSLLSQLVLDWCQTFLSNDTGGDTLKMSPNQIGELIQTARAGFYETKANGAVVPLPPSLETPVQMLNNRFLETLVSGSTPKDDEVILRAARVSHQFVCIHPYRDGNGRVSRLLMNLSLAPTHPPVYLKADKKGRHRYMQALRRADRGNLTALANLICLNLIEVYEHMLKSIGRNTGHKANRSLFLTCTI